MGTAIDKDIVKFDVAVELLSIDFDMDVAFGYEVETRQLYLCSLEKNGEFYEFYKPDIDIPAPLKQQVLRWFRDKHGFDFYISRNLPNVASHDYHVVIDDIWWPHCSRKTYEEAEDVLIDNLIKLVKEKK